MHAIVHERYGRPEEVLHLAEVPVPDPDPDEVLLRVHAASMHPDIWHVVTGRPYVLRLMGNGLRRPKHAIPGIDAAGVVEAVGQDVTRFTPGDAVFGETVRGHQWLGGGAFAEQVAVAEDLLLAKPERLSFEQAAAVPTSGKIAVQVVREEAGISAGQRVLINGAGGSVGTFAVQLAKALGAEITAVDRDTKLEMLTSIGADHVVDHTQGGLAGIGEPFDALVDIASTLSVADVRRLLKPDGSYVIVGHDHFSHEAGAVLGGIPSVFKPLFLGPFVPQMRGFSIVDDPGDRLEVLLDRIEAGKLTPVLDRTFPMEEAVDALAHLSSGQALGKVVLTVET